MSLHSKHSLLPDLTDRSGGTGKNEYGIQSPADAGAISGETTQPFSPGHIEAHLASKQQIVDLDFSKLRLDPIVAEEPAARIVIHPRVSGLMISPYGGTGRFDNWIEVKTDDHIDGAESARVLVVSPSAEQVGCTISHEIVCFHLYFDPAQDRLILVNTARSRMIHSTRLDSKGVLLVPSREAATLCVGSWALGTENRLLVELQVLPRTCWSITPKLATKRRSEESSHQPPKRKKIKDSAYRAIAPDSLQAVSAGNALLKLGPGETIRIGADSKGYRLTYIKQIADQRNSSVWQAKHTDIPEKVIVVKVIKATSTDERESIQAVEAWIRESVIHSSLESHSAISSMLGSDARFQCIYTEHIDAKSLVHCRQPNSDVSNASISDSRRILADIASALSFVHGSNIVHNDIKLANILYSPVRGAVLIDFGLSFVTGHPLPTGGTPWYLAPEFARGWQFRGPPSDIWALGVVMLWLLGRIPMPETTPHWSIAHIHPTGTMQAFNIDANEAMARWHTRVDNARLGLERRGEALYAVVDDILASSLDNRMTAAELEQKMVDIYRQYTSEDKARS